MGNRGSPPRQVSDTRAEVRLVVISRRGRSAARDSHNFQAARLSHTNPPPPQAGGGKRLALLLGLRARRLASANSSTYLSS